MNRRPFEKSGILEAASAFNSSPVESVMTIGAGLVHASYLAKYKDGKKLIIQSCNTAIFKDIEGLIRNYTLITQALKDDRDFDLQVADLVESKEGEYLWIWDDQFWRSFTFIKNSYEKSTIKTPEEAYHVASAYGRFNKALVALSTDSLVETIPQFHDPIFRKNNFISALKNADAHLKFNCRNEVIQIEGFMPVMNAVSDLKLPKKITHNDAKLGNVLFGLREKPLAIIDLDTVMGGYAYYDFGDLVRSLTNSLPEDNPNINEVSFQLDSFQALYSGFIDGSLNSLSTIEIDHLTLGAKYIILEQAIRFLTDYLQGNQYYKTEYPTHNLVRCQNQLALLSDMTHKM